MTGPDQELTCGRYFDGAYQCTRQRGHDGDCAWPSTASEPQVQTPCEKYPHAGCGCGLDDGTLTPSTASEPTPYRPPLSIELSNKVRTGLRMNRLTQAMLARRVGATEKHVSRVLNGLDDGSIPFWDALLREAWRAREEGEKGNRPRMTDVPDSPEAPARQADDVIKSASARTTSSDGGPADA